MPATKVAAGLPRGHKRLTLVPASESIRAAAGTEAACRAAMLTSPVSSLIGRFARARLEMAASQAWQEVLSFVCVPFFIHTLVQFTSEFFPGITSTKPVAHTFLEKKRTFPSLDTTRCTRCFFPFRRRKEFRERDPGRRQSHPVNQVRPYLSSNRTMSSSPR